MFHKEARWCITNHISLGGGGPVTLWLLCGYFWARVKIRIYVPPFWGGKMAARTPETPWIAPPVPRKVFARRVDGLPKG